VLQSHLLSGDSPLLKMGIKVAPMMMGETNKNQIKPLPSVTCYTEAPTIHHPTHHHEVQLLLGSLKISASKIN
jgi:hypothetical protein